MFRHWGAFSAGGALRGVSKIVVLKRKVSVGAGSAAHNVAVTCIRIREAISLQQAGSRKQPSSKTSSWV